jgi:SAM-dependent methyltransferase
MNPFATPAMAQGYARSRPPLHERILQTALSSIPEQHGFQFALDLGCGAGLSTRPLLAIAQTVIGIEPVEAMARIALAIAPGAHFLAASATALPFPAASIGLMAAAGSLNYLDLELFFPEARRTLSPGGLLLVYDFSQGRSFPDSSALDDWFAEFHRRYPPPAGEARPLDPEILSALDSGFDVVQADRFEIPLTLSPEFYVSYVMTETNVAAAVRRGQAEDTIRGWCAQSLAPVFEGRPREVLFRGYYGWMRVTSA